MDKRQELTERLYAIGVVPVVTLADADLAPPLAEALLESKLACLEITFRTPAATESLRRIRRAVPGLLIGAGTILSIDLADLAIDSGADFLVAPGTNLRVVEHAIASGIPMIPGIATPTEIEAVLERGIELVKFFPAEQSGGVSALNALAGPYGSVRYIPTGGVSAQNLAAYLAVSEVVACGGSWMVKPELLLAGDFASVRQLAAEALRIVAHARASRPRATLPTTAEV